MKNNKITKTVKAGLTQASASGSVSRCMGLRETTIDGRNVLAVSPRLEAAVSGRHLPLAAFYDEEGREHILMHTTNPRHGLTVWSQGESSEIAMDVDASCALAVSGGFVVMTSRGPARLTRDAERGWCFVEHYSCPAEVRLTAERVGGLSAQTHPMSLSGTDFTRLAARLSEAGEKKLTAELTEAYHNLAASAAGSGNWIQPIQARYRLIGRSGEILYSSAPMAMCPDGWQAESEVSVVCSKSGNDTLEVPRIILSVNAFRIKVDVSAESLARMRRSGVQSIEVLATPQIHPFDAAATAYSRISREATDAPALSVTIPGARTGFAAQNGVRLSRFIYLEHLIDSAAERIALIDLDSIAGSIQCQRSDARTPEEEYAALERIIEADRKSSFDTVDSSAEFLSEISSPHSFTAATVAVSGDTVVWGDITPVAARSVSIEDFTTDFIADPYEGVLVIKRTDGSRRVMAVSGEAMPTAWAPQVSFPEAGVMELELYLRSKSGAAGRYGAVSLTPGGNGRRSVRLNNNLESTPLEEWYGTLPEADDTPAGERRPGALVTCLLSQPLLPMAALECSHSPVRAIHPALRSRSSWDFSRARFYALTADAIHAVSISPQRVSISASAMDARGVDAGSTSVYTPLGVMALHRGNLLKISGSGVDTIASGIDFSQLAWDDEWQSLWLLGDNGDMRMLDPKTLRWTDIASPANFEVISTVGNRLWLTDFDDLYRPETRAEQCEATMRRNISWHSDIELPDATAVNAIELRMSASSANLTITVAAHPGPAMRPEVQLMKVRLQGRLTAPFIGRFPALRRPFLSISISGTCEPDFLLHSVMFKTIRHDYR